MPGGGGGGGCSVPGGLTLPQIRLHCEIMRSKTIHRFRLNRSSLQKFLSYHIANNSHATARDRNYDTKLRKGRLPNLKTKEGLIVES